MNEMLSSREMSVSRLSEGERVSRQLREWYVRGLCQLREGELEKLMEHTTVCLEARWLDMILRRLTGIPGRNSMELEPYREKIRLLIWKRILGDGDLNVRSGSHWKSLLMNAESELDGLVIRQLASEKGEKVLDFIVRNHQLRDEQNREVLKNAWLSRSCGDNPPGWMTAGQGRLENFIQERIFLLSTDGSEKCQALERGLKTFGMFCADDGKRERQWQSMVRDYVINYAEEGRRLRQKWRKMLQEQNDDWSQVVAWVGLTAGKDAGDEFFLLETLEKQFSEMDGKKPKNNFIAAFQQRWEPQQSIIQKKVRRLWEKKYRKCPVRMKDGWWMVQCHLESDEGERVKQIRGALREVSAEMLPWLMNWVPGTPKLRDWLWEGWVDRLLEKRCGDISFVDGICRHLFRLSPHHAHLPDIVQWVLISPGYDSRLHNIVFGLGRELASHGLPPAMDCQTLRRLQMAGREMCGRVEGQFLVECANTLTMYLLLAQPRPEDAEDWEWRRKELEKTLENDFLPAWIDKWMRHAPAMEVRVWKPVLMEIWKKNLARTSVWQRGVNVLKLSRLPWNELIGINESHGFPRIDWDDFWDKLADDVLNVMENEVQPGAFVDIAMMAGRIARHAGRSRRQEWWQGMQRKEQDTPEHTPVIPWVRLLKKDFLVSELISCLDGNGQRGRAGDRGGVVRLMRHIMHVFPERLDILEKDGWLDILGLKQFFLFRPENTFLSGQVTGNDGSSWNWKERGLEIENPERPSSISASLRGVTGTGTGN